MPKYTIGQIVDDLKYLGGPEDDPSSWMDLRAQKTVSVPALEGLARSAGDSATLGWADKIAAVPAAAYYALTEPNSPGFVQNYKDISRMNQKRTLDYQRNHPVASGVARAGGAVLGGILTPSISAATLPGRIAAGVATGAVEGGIYGAGRAPAGQEVPAALAAIPSSAAMGAAAPVVAAAVGRVPDMLRRGAANNWMNLLAPTKTVAPSIDEVAPVLANEVPMHFTEGGLSDYLARRRDQLGSQLRTGYAAKGDVGGKDLYDLFNKIDDLRFQNGARIPSVPNAVQNQPVDDLVTQMQDDLAQMVNSKGKVPASALWENKSRLWTKGTDPKTGTLKLTNPHAVGAVDKGTAAAYKDTLDRLYPDMAPVNTSYSAVARAAKAQQDLAEAMRANENYVRRGGTHGFGGLVKSVVPAAVVPATVGYYANGLPGAVEGGLLGAAARYYGSTAHNTGMARAKTKAANALDRVSPSLIEAITRRSTIPYFLQAPGLLDEQ